MTLLVLLTGQQMIMYIYTKGVSLLKRDTPEWQIKITHSDQQGNEHRNSPEYIGTRLSEYYRNMIQKLGQIDKFDSLNRERGEIYKESKTDIEELHDE